MTKLVVTSKLRGDLGELYFKHLCEQRKYAYIRPEEIYKSFTPAEILNFKFGYERLLIKIPEAAVDEIRRVSKPKSVNGTPSFVFDFLTCKIHKNFTANDVNYPSFDDLFWVEIKTGSNPLSIRQQQMRQNCKIAFSSFRVRDVMTSPNDIDIDWEIDSRWEQQLRSI